VAALDPQFFLLGAERILSIAWRRPKPEPGVTKQARNDYFVTGNDVI
jgi:hypothetical protein